MSRAIERPTDRQTDKQAASETHRGRRTRRGGRFFCFLRGSEAERRTDQRRAVLRCAVPPLTPSALARARVRTADGNASERNEGRDKRGAGLLETRGGPGSQGARCGLFRRAARQARVHARQAREEAPRAWHLKLKCQDGERLGRTETHEEDCARQESPLPLGVAACACGRDALRALPGLQLGVGRRRRRRGRGPLLGGFLFFVRRGPRVRRDALRRGEARRGRGRTVRHGKARQVQGALGE